jgi:hypothetical protein
MAPRHRVPLRDDNLPGLRDRPDDEELSGQSLRCGLRGEASLLAFPPFCLHLAQCFDCAVEIAL